MPSSKKLKKYASILRELSSASATKRHKWLGNNKNCTKGFVDCICVCAKNILKGSIPLSADQRKTLSRNKKALRHLISKKLSLNKKRRILQKGGFLGALIGPIVSVLGGLLGGVLGGGNKWKYKREI